MKDAFEHSQDSTARKDEDCNEKKCATCFANRGCMYDVYSMVPASNLKKFCLETLMMNEIPMLNKRA
jgi:hypothetical protein